MSQTTAHNIPAEGQHEAPSENTPRRPARLRDLNAGEWRDIVLRVRRQVGQDRLGLVSAGVAFFGFLAVFPALAAVISIGGLIIEPAEVQQHIGSISAVLPPAAESLLSSAAQRIAGIEAPSLGLGVLISLLLTLWSANKGMKGLIQAIAIAYDESDRQRGFVAKTALSLALTSGIVVLVLLSLALVVAIPIVLKVVGLGALTESAIDIGRWPALAAVIMAALAMIYRVSPPRSDARWQWVTPGAVVAATIWMIASAAFSYYTSNFGSYDETYGSVAAVAILLIWFQISAFVVLLGAEINCESEKQTARDTTTGPAQPMGERGAVAADTVVSGDDGARRSR